jgi:O-antigen ligase
MDKESIEVWSERTVVGLILATLGWATLATGAVRPGDLLGVIALTVTATLAWVSGLVLRNNPRILWPPVAWAVLTFVGLAVARYHQAAIEYLARLELIRILVYALVFTMVLNLARRQETVQVLLFGLVALATLNAMYAVYQFATDSPRVWHFLKPEAYLGLGSGSFINPNHLAGFLGMIFPVALAFAIRGRLEPIQRVVLGYAALVILVGIGTTFSTVGWIATTISTLLLGLWLSRRWWQRFLIAAVLAATLIASAIVFTHQVERVKRRMADAARLEHVPPSKVRFGLWQASARMWLDHPWWGVGPAHFDARFPHYRPLEVQARPGYSHNDYLNLLADWGLAGFLLVAAAAGCVAWSTRYSWKHVIREADLGSRASNREAAVIGSSAGLLTLCLHSFADFNLQIPANALTAVTLLALLASHVRYATERFWVGSRFPARYLLAAACLAAGTWLSLQSWRLQTELHLLNQADQAGPTTAEGIDALRRASAAEPANPTTPYTLGEALRLQSWQGQPGYQELAQEALVSFDRAARLNPYDAQNPLRRGLCLDWLGQHEAATLEYDRALALDPHNYFIVALRGWHALQSDKPAEATPWFEESLKLQPERFNPVARTYLEIVRRQLAAKPPNP